MVVYRLSLAKYVDSAFSGEGSHRVGSRWTPPGYAAVYTSCSIALAVLETLVHVDASIMPKHRVIRVDVPDDVSMTSISIDDLPSKWRATPAPDQLQQIGRDWLDDGKMALLKLPSVVVPQENNVIINTAHSDFKRFRIGQPDRFLIDSRLL